ncbi:MAG: SIS domain-containing protein, partial [Atopobium minutum]|nr:SIS domain-containing protein [Atopobium minutum]
EMLCEVGASTIVITSNPSSPLASLADACLVTIAEETAYRSESLASRISQLALVDTLYTIVMFSDESAASRSLEEVREVISTTRRS